MLKRSVAVLTCATVLALAAAPVASAQDPDELESYGAGASATALVLSILEQEFTFSNTSAGVGSKPEASAAAQAATTPIFSSDPSVVTSTGAPQTGSSCVLDLDLPEPLNLTGGGISCVETRAAVADGAPDASSESAEVTLDIISAELLGDAVDDVLRPLLEQLLAGVDGVLAALDVLLPLSDVSLDTLIDLVLDDLADGGPIARVQVGRTSSTATDVEGLAEVDGVDIELLPGLLPGGGALPVATITVGDAFSRALYDPATGDVTTSGEAAFLDVNLIGLELILDQLVENVLGAVLGALPVGPLQEVMQTLVDTITSTLNSLDDPDGPIEGLVNQTIDQLACPDSPLAMILCFEAGTVHELDAAGLEAYGFTFGEGTKGTESTILGLSVLDNVIELGIGQTAAGANGVPAAPLPSEPTDPAAPDPNLPRTGGSPSVPLALALFAAATVGLGITRRTRAA